jgi:hypothetical protein
MVIFLTVWVRIWLCGLLRIEIGIFCNNILDADQRQRGFEFEVPLLLLLNCNKQLGIYAVAETTFSGALQLNVTLYIVKT